MKLLCHFAYLLHASTAAPAEPEAGTNARSSAVVKVTGLNGTALRASNSLPNAARGLPYACLSGERGFSLAAKSLNLPPTT